MTLLGITRRVRAAIGCQRVFSHSVVQPPLPGFSVALKPSSGTDALESQPGNCGDSWRRD